MTAATCSAVTATGRRCRHPSIGAIFQASGLDPAAAGADHSICYVHRGLRERRRREATQKQRGELTEPEARRELRRVDCRIRRALERLRTPRGPKSLVRIIRALCEIDPDDLWVVYMPIFKKRWKIVRQRRDL